MCEAPRPGEVASPSLPGPGALLLKGPLVVPRLLHLFPVPAGSPVPSEDTEYETPAGFLPCAKAPLDPRVALRSPLQIRGETHGQG